MDAGFWDFSINFGDVVLAFVGVGGGAYTGGRAVQVARHRADLRLRFYEQLLPQLRRPAERAGKYYGDLDDAGHLVQLLPLPERELWRRYVLTVAEIADAMPPDEQFEGAGAEALAQEIADAHGKSLRDETIRQLNAARTNNAANKDPQAIADAIDPFARYLEMRIRPGVWRSLRARIRATGLRWSAAKQWIRKTR